MMQNSNISPYSINIDLLPTICEDDNLQLLPTNGVDHEQFPQHLSVDSLDHSIINYSSPTTLSTESTSSFILPDLIHHPDHFEQIISQFELENNLLMSSIHLYLNHLNTGTKQKQQQKKSVKLFKIRRRGLECSICFEKIKKNSFIPFLPCKHYFHQKCINKWIELKSNCPLCRNYIQ